MIIIRFRVATYISLWVIFMVIVVFYHDSHYLFFYIVLKIDLANKFGH